MDPQTLYDKRQLVQEVRRLIHVHQYVIVEGLIRDVALVKSMFHGFQFMFLYIEPIDLMSYTRNVMMRFLENPHQYGRLTFLRNMDHNRHCSGLTDFVQNGIHGQMIQRLIHDGASYRFPLAQDLFETYSEHFSVHLIRSFCNIPHRV